MFFFILKQILKGLLEIPFRLEESWVTCSSGPIKSSADLTLHWFSWKFHTKNSGPCGRCWSPASNVLSHPPQEVEWNTSRRERLGSQKATGSFFILSSRYCCWDPWGIVILAPHHISAGTSQQAMCLLSMRLWGFSPSVGLLLPLCQRVELCLQRPKTPGNGYSTLNAVGEVIENGQIETQYYTQNIARTDVSNGSSKVRLTFWTSSMLWSF